MSNTVTMPKLSPTMEGGTIVKWHVQEGDKVADGQLLIEVATDKATVEYNALDGGFLRKILVPEGSDAKINQPIAIITATADEPFDEPALKEEESKTVDPAKKEEEKQPTEAAKGGAIAQPAFVPIPPLENYTFTTSASNTDRIKASPLARKIAKEKGLDLASVKGSGPGGRIVEKDLAGAQPASQIALTRGEHPHIQPGTYTEEPLSPMRKAIGERLQASKMFIPHFYVQQEINATPLTEVRAQLKNSGIKLTFNDFVMRACALALREHPNVNAGFNSETNSIIRFETVDIAVAVSIDGGLITPIVRHTDYLTLADVSSEVKRLAKRAKEGKLQPEEYQGGSFTVSNLGMYGIHDFQAVINPPQAAILAVGGILDKAVVMGGEVVPGKTMMLSLSVDHRVVDGADAAAFIIAVQKYLENPSALLI